MFIAEHIGTDPAAPVALGREHVAHQARDPRRHPRDPQDRAATVGELDSLELVYAESRGLDEVRARALLLEGFVMGLWDSASDGDAIREAARDALRRIV